MSDENKSAEQLKAEAAAAANAEPREIPAKSLKDQVAEIDAQLVSLNADLNDIGASAEKIERARTNCQAAIDQVTARRAILLPAPSAHDAYQAYLNTQSADREGRAAIEAKARAAGFLAPAPDPFRDSALRR